MAIPPHHPTTGLISQQENKISIDRALILDVDHIVRDNGPRARLDQSLQGGTNVQKFILKACTLDRLLNFLNTDYGAFR